MMKKLLFSFLTVSAFAVHAAVITPTLESVVDPAGGQTVDTLASSSADLATFNGQSNLNVIGDWTGASGNSNIIDLADVDIRIISPAAIYTDGKREVDLYRTSPGDNFAWVGTDGQTLTIEFGTWNGSTFTLDRTIQSAGLTLVNFGGAYDTASDQAITYFDASSNVLSTQVFAGGPDSDVADSGTGTDAFSGYISGSRNISYFTVEITRASGSSDIAIDDLAFAIPEPSTFALFGLAGVAMMLGLRRRK